MNNNFSLNSHFNNFEPPSGSCENFLLPRNPTVQLCKSQNPEFFYFTNSLEIDPSDGSLIVFNGQMIDNRFFVESLLGKGSFGQVIKCKDLKTNMDIAIKILNPLKSVTSIASEINTLKYINNNDRENLFVKYFEDFNWKNFHCVVLELLGENLYDYLKRNNFNGMSFCDVLHIAFQLVCALHKLVSLGIVHCDIKPENIAFVENTPDRKIIKLIDFGSSCYSGKTVYTYIQSRFYRALEVILEIGYDVMIDIWSVGCVLVELYTGSPLFPGNNELEQLTFFSHILGPIPDHLSIASPKFSNLFILEDQRAYVKYIDKVCPNSSKSLTEIILNCSSTKNHIELNPNNSKEKHNIMYFVDLISRMLIYDPALRLRPIDCLSHPLLCELNRPSYLRNILSVFTPNVYPIKHQPVQIPGVALVRHVPVGPRYFNGNYVHVSPKNLYPQIPNQLVTYSTPYFVNYSYSMPFQLNGNSNTTNEPITLEHNAIPFMVSHYMQTSGMCSCYDCSLIGSNFNYYFAIARSRNNRLLY